MPQENWTHPTIAGCSDMCSLASCRRTNPQAGGKVHFGVQLWSRRTDKSCGFWLSIHHWVTAFGVQKMHPDGRHSGWVSWDRKDAIPHQQKPHIVLFSVVLLHILFFYLISLIANAWDSAQLNSRCSGCLGFSVGSIGEDSCFLCSSIGEYRPPPYINQTDTRKSYSIPLIE